MSKTILLNQNWIFSKEGHDEPVTLPHTWNAIDGQDGGNDYYRGTCCYTTVLPDIVLPENGRAVLQFDAVAINRRVKGSMSIDCLSLDDAHEYHEWSYTTARGETVSVYSGNHQFIVLYNGENAFISLVSQPGDSLGDDEIKAYVESVDLSALDIIGHINLPA